MHSYMYSMNDPDSIFNQLEQNVACRRLSSSYWYYLKHYVFVHFMQSIHISHVSPFVSFSFQNYLIESVGLTAIYTSKLVNSDRRIKIVSYERFLVNLLNFVKTKSCNSLTVFKKCTNALKYKKKTPRLLSSIISLHFLFFSVHWDDVYSFIPISIKLCTIIE